MESRILAGVLEKAKGLISNPKHWARGDNAIVLRSNGLSYGMKGSIFATLWAQSGKYGFDEALTYLDAFLPTPYEFAEQCEDDASFTHDEAMEIFDMAISAAKTENEETKRDRLTNVMFRRRTRATDKEEVDKLTLGKGLPEFLLVDTKHFLIKGFDPKNWLDGWVASSNDSTGEYRVPGAPAPSPHRVYNVRLLPKRKKVN